MFLDQEFHTVCDVLEETRKDGFTHPRTVVDTVNGWEVFVSISEIFVQPFIDGTDRFSEAKWKHVPPFSSGYTVFTDPKRAEGSGCTVAVLHTSYCLSFNPKDGELREEEHQKDDVHQGKGGHGKGN